MDAQALSKYLHLFGSLSRNRELAPHKPVLLISVLDEIDRGHISENRVYLSVELVAAFRENWCLLPLPSGNWLERVWVPFRYLLTNGFWELINDGETLSGKEAGDPHSVGDLLRRVHYARFASDLWVLLQDRTARMALRQHLLQVYFGITPGQVQPVVPQNPMAAQLQRLIAESQSQARPKRVREKADDTAYFLRHALFPQVIRAVYEDQCAVCGLFARAGKSSVVESAHIKPFADFHDDHPSNGIALCKNHHWGFDAGGFSISDDYTVIVSPHLRHSPGHVFPGAAIHLPTSQNCYPSPSSLAYHREHTFLK